MVAESPSLPESSAPFEMSKAASSIEDSTKAESTSEGSDGEARRPLPGRQIGHYVVQDTLGAGGMGRVYKVWDTRLRRSVALKLLPAAFALDAASSVRFRREVELLVSQVHPAFIRVFDSGEFEGALYYTMELVEGRTLEDKVPLRGLPHQHALSLLLKIARGVDQLHLTGVIHRDIKPSNILIRLDGDPILSDFGLAHFVSGKHSLTQSGVSMGTPAYMAPEQVKGDRLLIGPATDVYQLGATLFHALTGRAPHRGETPHDVMMAIVESPGPDFSQTNLPLPLRSILEMAMHRTPSKRYATAGAFADDLQRFLNHEWVAARGSNRLGRLWYKLQNFAAPLAILVLGASFLTTILMLASGLDEERTPHNVFSSGTLTAESERSTYVALESTVFEERPGGSVVLRQRSQQGPNDLAPQTGQIGCMLSVQAGDGTRDQPDSPLGWGDYFASWDLVLPAAKDAEHSVILFLGTSPDALDHGTVVELLAQSKRLVIRTQGHAILDVATESVEAGVRIVVELTHLDSQFSISVSQPGLGTRRSVYTLEDLVTTANTVPHSQRHMGLVTSAESLLIGRTSYRQLEERGDPLALLLATNRLEDALVRIQARLRGIRSATLPAQELSLLHLRHGLVLARLARVQRDHIAQIESEIALLRSQIKEQPAVENSEGVPEERGAPAVPAQLEVLLSQRESADSALGARIQECRAAFRQASEIPNAGERAFAAKLAALEFEIQLTVDAPSTYSIDSLTSWVRRASDGALGLPARQSALVCLLQRWAEHYAELSGVLAPSEPAAEGVTSANVIRWDHFDRSLQLLETARGEAFSDRGLRLRLLALQDRLLSKAEAFAENDEALRAQRTAVLWERVYHSGIENDPASAVELVNSLMDLALRNDVAQGQWAGIYAVCERLLKPLETDENATRADGTLDSGMLPPAILLCLRDASLSDPAPLKRSLEMLSSIEERVSLSPHEQWWVQSLPDLLLLIRGEAIDRTRSASLFQSIVVMERHEQVPLSFKGYSSDLAWKYLLLAAQSSNAEGQGEARQQALDQLEAIASQDSGSWLTRLVALLKTRQRAG